MAKKDDKIVEVFSNLKVATEQEIAEANTVIQELAKNPNPNNRYEIAQIVGHIVTNKLRDRINYLDLLADVKRSNPGEKAQFTVELEGIKAFIQAKDATTHRTTIREKHVILPTVQVSARPYVNFFELASGKVDFARLINKATEEMEKAMIKKIQNVLYAGFVAYQAPNYAKGSGIVKATIDEQINTFGRFGGVSIIGDIAMTSQLTGLTGFFNNVPDALAVEHNNNGMIGTYNSGRVIKLVNPLEYNDLTKTILKNNLLYILPAGEEAMRPLKVEIIGDVQAMDDQKIDDKTYEVRLDLDFGAGIVGSEKYMGIYEDESL